MTKEQKLEALFKAVNKSWKGAFDGWEWASCDEESQRYLLGEPMTFWGFAFFLTGCEDIYGGVIWLEYEPEKDLVGIYVKDRAIHPKFKDDMKALFEKHAPFGMKVSFGEKDIPILSREEKVAPKDLVKFFDEFKEAYRENYPLFYMFTVSAKSWYDGFSVAGSDC